MRRLSSYTYRTIYQYPLCASAHPSGIFFLRNTAIRSLSCNSIRQLLSHTSFLPISNLNLTTLLSLLITEPRHQDILLWQAGRRMSRPSNERCVINLTISDHQHVRLMEVMWWPYVRPFGMVFLDCTLCGHDVHEFLLRFISSISLQYRPIHFRVDDRSLGVGNDQEGIPKSSWTSWTWNSSPHLSRSLSIPICRHYSLAMARDLGFLVRERSWMRILGTFDLTFCDMKWCGTLDVGGFWEAWET